MSPPTPEQIVRAAGPLARLLGLEEDAAALLALASIVSMDAAVELVAALADVAARLDPEAAARRRSCAVCLGTGCMTCRVPRIAALAAGGASDPEIARVVGLRTEGVRSARRRHGIAPGTRGAPRSGWQAALTASHGRGLTVRQMASAHGWTVRTVRARLSLLGLRAHRRAARADGR